MGEFHENPRLNEAIMKMRKIIEPFTDDERFVIFSILEELDLQDKTLIQRLDDSKRLG
ncbi:TPA_asm: hypothetical protein vir519_00015 [Caudoviricetes sp. vir519]|nr:TPA_asm: hypothetical protein vir519_00015 [Caudoviricetes sp. vir519]